MEKQVNHMNIENSILKSEKRAYVSQYSKRISQNLSRTCLALIYSK